MFVVKIVSDLQQVIDFCRSFQFSPPINSFSKLYIARRNSFTRLDIIYI